MGLGSFPEVSLAQARQKAKDARELVRQGINPIDAKDAARSAAAAARAASKTFAECAEKYIDIKSPEWDNVKHLSQWRTTIETFANPVIGKLFVQDVDTPHLMAILEPSGRRRLKPRCGYVAGLNPSSIGQRSAAIAPGRIRRAGRVISQ